MHSYQLATFAAIVLTNLLSAAPARPAAPTQPLPRTADRKPNLEGIWQASGTAAADLQDHGASWNMLAGQSVVFGGAIPYQPWAAAKKVENFQNRQKADPLNQCYIPGVPRVMYLDYPFQIFQTPQAIGIAFEWSLDYRLIYMDGSRHPMDIDFWMGDSRGRWEGDTLVVDVSNNNDKTWFDMAGDFHSDALHMIERYRMTDPDTIQYEATIDDAKVFTKAWTLNVTLHRRTDRDRLFEYVCQAEKEETNGDFTREPRTWYPGDGAPVPALTAATRNEPAAPRNPPANIRRRSDGKPDLQGFYEPDAGGANYGVERHAGDSLTPGGRGVIIDPADGKLPMRPWAVTELADRKTTERGYDDPTAHCFPPGVPRSMYVPTAFYVIQTADQILFMHERTAWRIVRVDGRPHLPDSIRLWQGDSVGHWEGDTLVVDTTNLNGKSWLNEVGEIVSYAEHVVERFTPLGPDRIGYEATITDPVVYTRPWTIALAFNREKFDLTEGACHEEDHDLPHLKALKEAAKKK
ncbi:MAG TPA: hypothetical protein VGF16_16965 [Bryobacteraceae bacterium]|jgi:hypothetical protein